MVSCAVALIIFGIASAAAASAATAAAVWFAGSSGMFTGHANQMPAESAFCLSLSHVYPEPFLANWIALMFKWYQRGAFASDYQRTR